MAMNPTSLLDLDVVQVKQKAKLFELRNQYELFDGTGQPVGTVEQVNQSPLAVLGRIFSNLDVALAMELHIREATGTTALALRKPWFRMAVEVSDGGGVPLGSVRKRVRLGKARFTVLDPGGNVVGEVQAQNWRAREFVVAGPNGEELGRVSKRWAGAAKEFFTDADNYVIQVAPGVTGPPRAMVIATAFAVDIIMKQKDSG